MKPVKNSIVSCNEKLSPRSLEAGLPEPAKLVIHVRSLLKKQRELIENKTPYETG